MIGRARELAACSAALDRIGKGSSAYVELTGEAGLGKTSLLAALGEAAQERGWLTLNGRAAEFERGVPYALCTDALAPRIRALGDRILRRLDPDVLPALGGVVPGLTGVVATAAPVERHGAHRAVAQLLEGLAASTPLVLCLDDLHWADDASVDLLSALIQRPPQAGVLLALAARTGQLPPRVAGAGAEAARRGEAWRLPLEPLTSDEAAALLATTVDAPRAQAVMRIANGNPFYLEQLSRLGASGAVVPPGIAGAIVGEVDGLAEGAKLMLRAAAVAGDPFDPELAAEIAGLELAVALPLLDEAVQADVVRPTSVPRRFAFRHPLVRQAVYEATLAGWRLAAHDCAAKALARRGAPPEARAPHVEQSAVQGDAEAVVLLKQAAADVSMAAPATAAGFLRSALRLLAPTAGASQERRVLMSALAEALIAAGELEEARRILVDVLHDLPLDAAAERVAIETTCAQLEQYLGHAVESRVRLEVALEALPEGAAAHSAALEWALAVDALNALRWEDMRFHGERALAASRERGGDEVVAAGALAALACGFAASGQRLLAETARRTAVEMLEALPDQALTRHLVLFHHLGWAEIFLNRYRGALGHFQRGIRIGRTAGDGLHVVPLLAGQWYPLTVLGHGREGVAVGEEAVAVARLSRTRWHEFGALWSLAEQHYFQGRFPLARRLFDESLAVRKDGPPNFLTGFSPAPALVLFEDGEPEAGKRMFFKSVGGDALPNVVPTERPIAYGWLTYAEVAMGNLEGAREAAQLATDVAEPIGTPTYVAHGARARALVELASERYDAAAAEGRAAIELFMSVENVADAASTRQILAQALDRAGRRDEAVAALVEAERQFDAFGAEPRRLEVARALRQLGHRMPRRSAAAPQQTLGSALADLTPREREVAELVADNLTNRQIAQALYLSTKTVETHLRNVFAKLGATSRLEVARAIDRERALDLGRDALP
ncbi:MAG TPA: AAA family ATPase [Solirubrobacteraceae bacterium]|nr:AAA family ATPase [Solirubrobacteraceae bacterium]